MKLIGCGLLYMAKATLDPLAWLGVLLGSFLEWLLPGQVWPLCGGIAIFLGLDFITGTRAARKEGQAFEPARARSTCDKALGWVSLIIVVSLATRLVPQLERGQDISTAGVAFAAIVVEGSSVVRNSLRLGIKLPRGIRDRLTSFFSSKDPINEK